MYERPTLCRLCEFPVTDTGVRVAELDLQKLGRWWLQELGTEFDDDADTVGSSWICQFCLCDARFKGKQDTELGWWMGCAVDQSCQKFYLEDAVIKPCMVAIVLRENSEVNRQRAKGQPGVKNSTDCVYCGETFESIIKAYGHVMESHQDLETFPCRKCYRFYPRKCDLLEHDKDSHSNIVCHYCQEKFGSVAAVRQHIFQMHKKKDGLNYVRCCGKSFSNCASFSIHVHPSKTKMTKCIYCELNLNVSEVDSHVNKHHKAIAVRCNKSMCGKYFRNDEEKRLHASRSHEKNLGSVKCIYCQSSVIRSHISLHMTSMHSSKQIRCKYLKCLSYFHSEEEQKDHMKSVHWRVKVAQKVVCTYCSKLFNGNSRLYAHIRDKHSLERAQCKVFRCWKYFLSKDELRKHHQDVHEPEFKNKILKCPLCPYGSNYSPNFQAHMLSFHGSENLKCEMCPGTAFKSSLTLKRHTKRAHTIPKSQCIHCNYQVVNLNVHLYIIPCKYCKAMEPCKTLMRKHVKSCGVKLTIS